MCFARGPKSGTFSASAIDSSKKPPSPSHLWTLNACWRGCKLDQSDRNYIQAWKQYSCSFFQEQCSKKGRILRVLPLPNGDGHVCRESTSCLPKPPYFFKSAPWRPEQWEDSLKNHWSTTGWLMSHVLGIDRTGCLSLRSLWACRDVCKLTKTMSFQKHDRPFSS